MTGIDTPPAAALILAGGESRRMGSPKAALTIAGETFVGRLVRLLREVGIEEVLVVTGPDHAATRDALEGTVAELIQTAAPQRGPIGSIATGIEALGEQRTSGGLLVAPVDHPAIAASTLTAILTQAQRGPEAIVVPTHEGQRGHPTWFGAGVLGELRDPQLAGGARMVVRADAQRVAEVEVRDPGILRNIDTPEAYAALTADWPLPA